MYWSGVSGKTKSPRRSSMVGRALSAKQPAVRAQDPAARSKARPLMPCIGRPRPREARSWSPCSRWAALGLAAAFH